MITLSHHKLPFEASICSELDLALSRAAGDLIP